MDVNISQNDFDVIARAIASDDSPVGIDAKKTHVMIIHMLDEIAGRLDRIEERLEQIERYD